MIHGVPRSTEVAGMSFPGRDDYLQHFGIVTEAGLPMDIEPETVIGMAQKNGSLDLLFYGAIAKYLGRNAYFYTLATG